MFPKCFFAAHYFAPTYFPEGSAAQPPLGPSAGTWRITDNGLTWYVTDNGLTWVL